MTDMDKNLILLVNPPYYRLFKDTYSYYTYLLSLGYLAASIKKDTNWDVAVFNTDFNTKREIIKISYLSGIGFDNYLKNLKTHEACVWGEIVEKIKKIKPNVVGVTANSQNFKSACIVAKIIKNIDKNIIVILGGPHSTLAGAKVLDCQDIDISVKGEGEKTILELLKAIKGKKSFKDIRGIVYRQGKDIIENEPREFIENLDELPFPNENAASFLIDGCKYPKDTFSNVIISRGCAYECFFCAAPKIWGRKLRVRSPENAVEELMRLKSKGIISVNFIDSIFGINRKYLKKLCTLILEKCPGLKWSCLMHVKLIDEETTSLMKAAGCYAISIGVESGSNKILKAMGKQYTIEEAFSACELIKKKGIELHAFFIIGFPWDTEETLAETIDAMKRIKCDTIVYSIFTPYIGTKAYEFCKEKSLIDDDYDTSLYNHQSPANCFCLNIKPDRFRQLAVKVEKMVDRKNRKNRIKRLFSLNTFWRIKRVGVKASLKKGIEIFLGK